MFLDLFKLFWSWTFLNVLLQFSFYDSHLHNSIEAFSTKTSLSWVENMTNFVWLCLLMSVDDNSHFSASCILICISLQRNLQIFGKMNQFHLIYSKLFLLNVQISFLSYGKTISVLPGRCSGLSWHQMQPSFRAMMNMINNRMKWGKTYYCTSWCKSQVYSTFIWQSKDFKPWVETHFRITQALGWLLFDLQWLPSNIKWKQILLR